MCEDNCVNYGDTLGYIDRSINSYSVGCGVCALDDYLTSSI